MGLNLKAVTLQGWTVVLKESSSSSFFFFSFLLKTKNTFGQDPDGHFLKLVFWGYFLLFIILSEFYCGRLFQLLQSHSSDILDAVFSKTNCLFFFPQGFLSEIF